MGYWLREKAQAAWRWIKQAAAALAYWWSKRSRATRMRIFAVAGVVVLYLIIKFLPVPGVPCQISAAKECAPSDDTIAYVPRDALLYAHLTVNSDSHQWELAGDLGDELPNFTALLQSDTSSLATPAGRAVDLGHEVLPWAKDDLALIGVPGPKKTTAEAYVVGVGDNAKADQFLTSLSPGGKPKQAKVGGATLSVYSNGVATARSGDQALFGSVLAVRAALAAQVGPRCRGWRAPLRTPRAPTCRMSGSPRCISPRRGSAACSPGGPEAPPSSTPSWTTARAPAWPPRCGLVTTGWRSTWSATSIRSSSSAARRCSPPCRSSSRAWPTRPAPAPSATSAWETSGRR